MSNDHDHDSPDDRLTTELSLLESMYPSQITYDAHTRELNYKSDNTSTTNTHATLHLRLPDPYPSTSLPTILSATSPSKTDLREPLRQHLTTTNLPPNEEILDQIISIFDTLVTTSLNPSSNTPSTNPSPSPKEPESFTTVIIYLHHLLSTTKRKLALVPPPSTSSPTRKVQGITKPGYPGVLVFSGPADAVREHVRMLRGLQWQAFQVRFETGERWTFLGAGGDDGVREVEGMKDVVAGIEGEERREVFLGVMKVK